MFTVEFGVPIMVFAGTAAGFQYLNVYKTPPDAVNVMGVPGHTENELGVSTGVIVSIPTVITVRPGQPK
jgi:hypothetical protein